LKQDFQGAMAHIYDIIPSTFLAMGLD